MEIYSLRHRNGLLAEIDAARALVVRGYEIFWPQNQHSKVDFIAISPEGEVRKVQVKKASWSSTKYHKYLIAHLKNKSKSYTLDSYSDTDIDDFMFVDDEGRIWRVPFPEVKDFNIVYLGSSNPRYKSRAKYDPDTWRVV